MMNQLILKNKLPFLRRPVKLEQVVPDNSIKGMLLYATHQYSKPFSGGKWDWILLVDKFVYKNEEWGFQVSVHSNFSFSNNLFFIKPEINENFAWGASKGYTFYLLDEIHKKYYIELLNHCGFKFIKVLNKLIER